MPTDPPTPPRRVNPYGLMVVGSEMVSFTLVGLLVDWGLGSMPWATVGLTVLGGIAAFLHLIRMVKRPPDSEG